MTTQKYYQYYVYMKFTYPINFSSLLFFTLLFSFLFSSAIRCTSFRRHSVIGEVDVAKPKTGGAQNSAFL